MSLEASGILNFPIVTDEMKKKYASGNPFPYLVLDEFIKEEFLEQVRQELVAMSDDDWLKYNDPMANEMIFQKKKMGLNRPEWLPEKAGQLMRFFNSDFMVNYLSELTDIANLIPDHTYAGGGVHRTKRGGKLSVHADFNIHPDLGLHRRVNALLYMNKNWLPEWKGDLELWKSDMSECVHRLAPEFNRLIVFRITDDALHGHPDELESPEGVDRLSFAFYYYTTDRPEHEKAPFHWANWHSRPEKGY